MSLLHIMHPTQGDLKLEWDRDKTDEVAAARKAFDAAKKKGIAFFKMGFGSKPKKTEPVKSFDPYAEKIIGVPPVQGG